MGTLINEYIQWARHTPLLIFSSKTELHWNDVASIVQACPLSKNPDWQLNGHILKIRHMCSLQGCGRISLSQFLAHKGPDSSEDIRDCRTVPGTASKWWNNLETQQPILWSDEYLPTGGMLILSVLSQQAHMVPCCRRLQQERLFSRECLQFV